MPSVSDECSKRSAASRARIESFFERGWCRFGHDPVLAEWIATTLPSARAAVVDPANERWLRCGGTWFAGVNALPNDGEGAVHGQLPLAGAAVEFIREALGLTDLVWDRAQVSVCYPGYPQPMPNEKASAFRYRRDRDAAHVDGLLAEGPKRRRHLREHHAFILGIALTSPMAGASPLVVWEGSHEIVRSVLEERFHGLPPEQWGDEDITAIYQRTRREIFDRCRRVQVQAGPGEAYLVHRLALHGVAPWTARADPGGEGRMICYFRPDLPGGAPAWLAQP